MRKLQHAVVALRALDALDERLHVAARVVARERLAGERVAVEAGERYELPDVTHLREFVAEAADLTVVHAGRIPVERRRQVVRELHVRVHRLHAVRELARLYAPCNTNACRI